MLRIGLNLLQTLPEIGGGWNYAANLLEALARYGEEAKYVAFVGADSRDLIKPFSEIKVHQHQGNMRSRVARIWAENTWLLKRARWEALDVLYWPGNTVGWLNAVSSMVTLHDMQAFSPEVRMSKIKTAYLKAAFRNMASQARVVSPVSQAVADQAIRILSLPPDRVRSIPVVLPDIFRRVTSDAIAKVSEAFMLPSAYWLYIAHFYPHKNHLGLIAAYDELRKEIPEAWPLVLRGDDKGMLSDISAEVAARGLEQHVRFLPKLTIEEIVAVISGASGMVFPSFHEGGGIPVVEAMACGVPIAASRLGCVTEFAQNAAVYFAPHDVRDILNAMRSIQDQPDLQQTLIARGLKRAEDFRGQRASAAFLSAAHLAARR